MEDEFTGIEGRQHPRVSANSQAVVLARHNAGTTLTIVSLTLGGARLEGEISVAVGERVQILFELDGEPIDVSGEVVRVQMLNIATDHIAVRFLELAGRPKELIRTLVTQMLT